MFLAGLSCIESQWQCYMLITARKPSCGKVVFLHLSVILFTKEGVYPSMQWAGGLPREGVWPGGVHPLPTACWVSTHPWADTLPGRQTIPPPRDSHWSGQYASYWNVDIGIVLSKMCFERNTEMGIPLQYLESFHLRRASKTKMHSCDVQ